VDELTKITKYLSKNDQLYLDISTIGTPNMKKRYSLACNCYKIAKLVKDGTDDNDNNNDRKLREGSNSVLLTNH
jgi:hypothetical protein